MKKVLKTIFGFILFLIIPGIFGGFGAGVYFGLIAPYIEAKKIIKKGFETTAIIIDMESKFTLTTTTGIMTQKEQIYFLKLIFINSEKKEIEYKTGSIYPKSFIDENDIETGSTVQVIYLENKAVIKGFIPKYMLRLWLFPIGFGAIAIGFLLLFIVSNIMNEKDNMIKKFGTPTTAAYSDKKRLINADSFDLFSIICTYKNDNGDDIKVRTRFLYNNSEVKKIAIMGSFPIMYKDDKAVIMIE